MGISEWYDVSDSGRMRMSGWVYVRVVVKVSWYMMSVLVSG